MERRGFGENEVSPADAPKEKRTCRMCHSDVSHAPECPVINRAERDFHNADLASFAMSEGDEELARELREFYRENGIPEKRIDDAFLHQRQRREVQDEMALKYADRLKNNPEPTDEEVRMGVYVEQLEPHVLGAVRTFRQKGYETRGSGFSSDDAEVLYLKQGDTTFATLAPEVVSKLVEIGVEITSKGSSLRFQSAGMDLEALKAKWDEIATAMPDLGHPAQPAPPYHGILRKNAIKYGKIDASDPGPEDKESDE